MMYQLSAIPLLLIVSIGSLLGIGFILWTRLRPTRILCIIAFLLPFQVYINIGSIPLASGYLLVIVFILFTLLTIFLSGRKLLLPRLLGLMSLFLLGIFLSFFSAVDRVNFAVKASQIVLYVTFYWVVVNSVNEIRVIDKISQIVLISGVISALIGIVQFAVASFVSASFVTDLFYNKLGMLIFGVRGIQRIGSSEALGYFYRSTLPGVGQVFRAFGLFGGGNAFGFYHALIYAFSLTQGKNLFKKPLFFKNAVSIILAVATFLSWSRMAWLMLFFATVYHLFRTRLHVYLSLTKISHVVFFIVLIGSLGAMVVMAAWIFPDFPLSSAILATAAKSDASTISRLSSMGIGLTIFGQNPLTGIGLGNYPTVFDQALGGVSTKTAESLYIELLAEIGLLGFLPFIWFLIAIGRTADKLRQFPESKTFSEAFYSIWLSAIIGFAFNAVITEPRTMLLWWLLIGLLTACRRLTPRNVTQPVSLSIPYSSSISACISHWTN